VSVHERVAENHRRLILRLRILAST